MQRLRRKQFRKCLLVTGIVDDILSITDSILGLRDELGAIKHPIYILTRTWATQKGLGTPVDVIAQILPTPYLVDLSHSLNVREGGMVKQGDLLVKMISRQSYMTENLIDCTVSNQLVEKWYYIDSRLYEVISVTRDYVNWNVQIRKTIKQKTYIV